MDEPTPPQSTTAKNLEMMQLEKFSPAQINFNQKDFSLEFSIKCDFDLNTNLVIFKSLTGPSSGEYFLNFLAHGGLKYPRVNFMIDFFGRGDQGHGQSQSQIDIKQATASASNETKQEQITCCLFKNSNLISVIFVKRHFSTKGTKKNIWLRHMDQKKVGDFGGSKKFTLIV